MSTTRRVVRNDFTPSNSNTYATQHAPNRPGNIANIRYSNATGNNNWNVWTSAQAHNALHHQGTSAQAHNAHHQGTSAQAHNALHHQAHFNNTHFNSTSQVKTQETKPNYRCVAMDCEMVGIGEDTKTNMLARVSIVNSLGDCVYDTFVKPTAPVTDYRTAVSGVRPCDLVNAEKFGVVQNRVAQLIKGKVLVGHAIHNDLMVLKLTHPRHFIRDTACYGPFVKLAAGTPSLKRLTSHFLNIAIQEGEHNSIQDAQAAMQLYMMYRKEWEATVRKASYYHYNNMHKPKTTKPSFRGRRINRNYKDMYKPSDGECSPKIGKAPVDSDSEH